jgi:hypothetical protein
MALSQTRLFRLWAGVGCTDGDCGKLKSVVVNPGDDVVTHLVVEPARGQGLGRLVPVRLVQRVLSSAGGNEVRLDCTMAEFEGLDAAEATYLSPGESSGVRPEGSMASWPYYAPPGVMGGPGLPIDPMEGGAGRHRRHRPGSATWRGGDLARPARAHDGRAHRPRSRDRRRSRHRPGDLRPGAGGTPVEAQGRARPAVGHRRCRHRRIPPQRHHAAVHGLPARRRYGDSSRVRVTERNA